MLREVFHQSVHQLACEHYTAEQLAAWAPAQYDHDQWAARLAANRPFVAVVDGQAAGFADLQPSGYIDHFFVSPRFSRQGVATALMAHLLELAGMRAMSSLFANVSLSAEQFFAKSGFRVERRNQVDIGGIVLHNATMRLVLAAGTPQA